MSPFRKEGFIHEAHFPDAVAILVMHLPPVGIAIRHPLFEDLPEALMHLLFKELLLRVFHRC